MTVDGFKQVVDGEGLIEHVRHDQPEPVPVGPGRLWSTSALTLHLHTLSYCTTVLP